MDAPTSSPFRTTPDQINNLIGKPFCPISRASLHEKQEHLFFQGILEKRAGNFTFKSSWHERYFILATVLLRTSPAANAETIKTTGIPNQHTLTVMPVASLCIVLPLEKRTRLGDCGRSSVW